MQLEAIIYYLILLDAIVANVINFFARSWYQKNFKSLSKYFPIVTGWTLYYLVLVLWVGFALSRLGIINF